MLPKQGKVFLFSHSFFSESCKELGWVWPTASPQRFSTTVEKGLFNSILLLCLFGRHILLYNQLLSYPVLYTHLHSVPITNFILVMQRTINNLRLKRNLRAGIFHFCSRDRWYSASTSTQVIFVHAMLIQQIAFQTKCMQKVPGDST